MTTPVPTHGRSFRLVCTPNLIRQVESLLHAEGYEFEDEPFSPVCRRLLTEPVPLGSSLAAFFGYIYIQDRSSMLPPLALNPPAGSAVLDMCASPGGKSGFLAQLVTENGFVLANEANTRRLATLRANILRLNLPQLATCNYAGEKLSPAPGGWPYILLDPPCSGWGTLDKNPQAAKLWQGVKVDKLIGLQRQLLNHARRLLAPGGLLLYSTCTTNVHENEEQTVYAEEELGLERVPIAPFPGFEYDNFPGGHGCLRIAGEASAAQGFYLSLLRKPHNEAATSTEHADAKNWRQRLEIIDPDSLASPVFDPGLLPCGNMAKFGDKIIFLPGLADAMLPGESVWQGFLLGNLTKKGNQYIFNPDGRLRICFPPVSTAKIEMEQPAEIHKLLAGQSLGTTLDTRHASLWWRDLPLCPVGIRNGRILTKFH